MPCCRRLLYPMFKLLMVNFAYLNGDVPRFFSYGVYISHLIPFARICSHIDDFNNRNKFIDF